VAQEETKDQGKFHRNNEPDKGMMKAEAFNKSSVWKRRWLLPEYHRNLGKIAGGPIALKLTSIGCIDELAIRLPPPPTDCHAVGSRRRTLHIVRATRQGTPMLLLTRGALQASGEKGSITATLHFA
jgi:hypothetical protein